MLRSAGVPIVLLFGYTRGSVVKTSNGLLEGVASTDFWDYGTPSGDHSITKYLADEGVSDELQRPYIGREFNKLTIFRGVPFAEPPTGNLRFKKPLPYNGQFSTRNLTRFGTASNSTALDCTAPMPRCVQMILPDTMSTPMIPQIEQSEDCLGLDIYVPEKALSGTPLPVFVFIHGGGFALGSAQDNDGTFLASSEDKIVVMIQYRLGVLGFYSTGDSTSPGNYGLWDQRQALKWIHDEIHNFGGDPGQVHIAGESAGGASISYQIQFDQRARAAGEEQLFNKATVMSGAIFEGWPMHTNWALRLSKHMLHDFLVENDKDYTATRADTAVQHQFLMEVEAEKTVEIYMAVFMGSMFSPVMQVTQATLIPVGPVVDGDFLETKDPYNVHSSDLAGDYSGYDLTYGTINADGYVFFINTTINPLEQLIGSSVLKTQLDRMFSVMTDDELENMYRSVWLPEGLDGVTRLIESRKDWIEYEALSYYNSYAATSNGGYSPTVADPVEESIVWSSDERFTLPMISEMVQTRAGGARVNQYHLARGCDAGSLACSILSTSDHARQFWEHGYNIHGDDIMFLFGVPFCLDNYPRCQNRDSTALDKISSLQLINYIFNDNDYETNSINDPSNGFAVKADVFQVDGTIVEVNNFRQKYANLKYIGHKMLWNAVDKTEEQINRPCEDKAHDKWNAAFENWAVDHEKWQSSFTAYNKANDEL